MEKQHQRRPHHFKTWYFSHQTFLPKKTSVLSTKQHGLEPSPLRVMMSLLLLWSPLRNQIHAHLPAIIRADCGVAVITCHRLAQICVLVPASLQPDGELWLVMGMRWKSAGTDSRGEKQTSSPSVWDEVMIEAAVSTWGGEAAERQPTSGGVPKRGGKKKERQFVSCFVLATQLFLNLKISTNTREASFKSRPLNTAEQLAKALAKNAATT